MVVYSIRGDFMLCVCQGVKPASDATECSRGIFWELISMAQWHYVMVSIKLLMLFPRRPYITPFVSFSSFSKHHALARERNTS